MESSSMSVTSGSDSVAPSGLEHFVRPLSPGLRPGLQLCCAFGAFKLDRGAPKARGDIPQTLRLTEPATLNAMKRRLLILGIVLLSTAVNAQQQQAPDLVLFHGRVFTSDPANRWAEAVAIRGNRIVAVGTDSAVTALAGDSTKKIDLRGHLVIPGINDAHTHQMPAPERIHLALNRDPGSEDLLLGVGSGNDETPSTTWIFGEIGPKALADRNLTAAYLDKAAPGRKVLLESFTGHGAVFSSAALTSLRVREDAPDPAGGWFVRDESRRITGKAFEYAAWNLQRRINDGVDETEAIDALRSYADEALRYGITSIQNMAWMSLSRYEKLVRHGNIPLRIRMIRFPGTDTAGRDLREGRDLPATHPERPLSIVSGTKWILDGTPVEENAALTRPYHPNGENLGRLDFPPDEIAKMLGESLANKDQLLLHVAGDRTANVVLNAMKTMTGVDWKAQRVRFEHGDGVFGDRIAAVHDLGIVIVQNPTHFAALGLYPTAEYSPMKSLLKAGIHLAIGSDGAMNPYLNIMMAAAHPHPGESLTREEAVEAYTRESAYAEFAEADKGTIAAGKLADLAVLSQDIFRVAASALPETVSVLTILDGKVVYDAKQFSDAAASPHTMRSRQ
jgi:predicted amidohydrolase YtcJ